MSKINRSNIIEIRSKNIAKTNEKRFNVALDDYDFI